MHKILFTIIFCCCCVIGHAQKKGLEYVDTSLIDQPSKSTYEETVAAPEVDTTTDNIGDILSDTTLYVTRIDLSRDSVTKWKNDKRFAYMKDLDNLLKQKQRDDASEVKNVPTDTSPSFLEKVLSSGAIKIFFWTVAIVFVLFILYKLFLSNGIFKRNTRSSPVNELLEEEKFVSVSDYDKLIHQSVKLGDFRMAVRYLFLKNLAHLADKEYLHLSADKTNYEYVQEIRADKKNEFSSLVLTYEYIWYGNFSLNQETYTGIEKKYNSFYNKI